jgi:hypothetical protein
MCYSAECHSNECHSTECRSNECHSNECHLNECHSARFLFANCHSAGIILPSVILLCVDCHYTRCHFMC